MMDERTEKRQKSVDRARAQSHLILRRSIAELAKLQKERSLCDKARTTPNSVPHHNPRPPARRRASTLAPPRHHRRRPSPASGRSSRSPPRNMIRRNRPGGSTSATGYTGEGKSALCALNGMLERRLQISGSTRFHSRKQSASFMTPVRHRRRSRSLDRRTAIRDLRNLSIGLASGGIAFGSRRRDSNHQRAPRHARGKKHL